MDTGDVEEITGYVDKIIFRNDDNGFTIVKVEEKHFNTVACGSLATVHEGEYIRFAGRYIQHKSYGRQFQITRKLPHNSKTGLIKYMASRGIKGIGERTAKKIVDHFGTNTLDILDKKPSRLEEVPSIGKKKLRRILDGWEVERTYRGVEVFLMSNSLSPKIAHQIIKTYGPQTMTVLTENPFRLAMDISGIGFKSADRFAHSMGIASDSKERLRAAIHHALQKGEEEGHCYLSTEQLTETLVQIMQVDKEAICAKLPEALFDLERRHFVVNAELSEREGLYGHYLRETYEAESLIATRLRDLSRPLNHHPERLNQVMAQTCYEATPKLSDEQALAVRSALENGVFILTGGPGVGKSTTANAIIKALASLPVDVALAAPTGRAAQRLMEITGEEATTIHRLLKWSPQERCFQHNRHNPLTTQALVVDEVSMLDNQLAAALLDAISEKTQVIFIGDTDQLPSVGAGFVLGDMIASKKIPHVRLTTVFRQAAQSDIVRIAHAINEGVVPEFSNTIESDCRFIEVEDPRAGVETIKKLVKDILPKKAGYDPIEDIQVLSPMKRSDLGTDSLNKALQMILNPSDEKEGPSSKLTLRRGDKVIQTVNNYELNVFNGDIGIVQEAGLKDQTAIISFGQKEVAYRKEQLDMVRLAYAITIHKSQGSEFPVVIIPISTQHYVMLERNLIYTAVTRAKKMVILVGTKKALRLSCQTKRSHKRNTRLSKMI